MYASHATKKKVRYRYNISRSLQTDDGGPASGFRLPAREIESVVKEHVAQAFDDPLMLASRLALDVSPNLLRQMNEACYPVALQLRSRTAGPLRDLVTQVRALDGRLEIELNAGKVVDLLGLNPHGELAPLTLGVEYRLTRTGNAIRLIQDNGALAVSEGADPALLKQILQARRWWNALSEGKISIATLARQEGVTRSYISRVIGVAFLAPAVIEAVLEGQQHGELDAALLRQTDAVPVRWTEQMAKFLPT